MCSPVRAGFVYFLRVLLILSTTIAGTTPIRRVAGVPSSSLAGMS